MTEADITWSKIDSFPIWRREILEQFNFVPITFQHRDRNFRSGNAGDFAGKFSGLVWPMRKLEAEHITPESERAFEVGNGDAGVIGRDDAEFVIQICANFP